MPGCSASCMKKGASTRPCNCDAHGQRGHSTLSHWRRRGAERAVIGPHVTLGPGTTVKDSRIQNALIAGECLIENAVIDGAMLGAHATWHGSPADGSLGDYCSVGTPRE